MSTADGREVPVSVEPRLTEPSLARRAPAERVARADGRPSSDKA